MKTFFQLCVWLSISLILFNLGFAVVNGMGIFTPVEGGISAGDDASSTVSALTDVDADGKTGMEAIWVMVAGTSIIAAAGGVALGLIFHSTVFVGISLFSTVFWASYVSTYILLETMFGQYGLGGFLIMATVGVSFLFIAAIIGMLSGSG